MKQKLYDILAGICEAALFVAAGILLITAAHGSLLVAAAVLLIAMVQVA